MRFDTTENISIDIDIFGTIMLQNIIDNKFNREYATLVNIQHCALIEFSVTGISDLYLDLNKSRRHMLANITKSNRTNIDADTAGFINLPMQLMFKNIALKLNN